MLGTAAGLNLKNFVIRVQSSIHVLGNTFLYIYIFFKS